MKKGMKSILSLLLTGTLLASVLAGCSASAGSSTVSSGSSSAAASADKQVVIGINADYTTFDPALVYEKSADMIMGAAYDTLVAFDKNDSTKIVPSLAESWEISADKLTYTFKLRSNVKATTGKVLNAKDVEYCFNRLDSLKGNPSFLMDGIEKVEATGDFEVKITLKEVNAAVLSVLTKCNFSVYDSDAAKANGGTCVPETDTAQKFFDTTSIGSGPYKIQSYTPKAEAVLVRSDSYWGQAPAVKQVVFKQVNDASMQMMMLQKGDIDFAFDLTSEQTAVLSSDSKVVIKEYPTLDIFMFMMNVDKTVGGPFADKKVREAISYALDYEGLCKLAGNGAKTPYNIIPDGFAGYLGNSTVKRDVAKAKQLLKEAGYENGFSFDCGAIPDMAPDGVAFMDCAQKIQSDLKEVGITMNISSDEVSVYLEKLRGAKYQASIGMWGPDYIDPSTQLSFMPGEVVGLRSNWTKEMAPDLAALSDKAKVEVDDAKRVELFKQIQKKYNEEAGPNIVFVQPNRILAQSTRITKSVYTPAHMLELSSLDVA